MNECLSGEVVDGPPEQLASEQEIAASAAVGTIALELLLAQDALKQRPALEPAELLLDEQVKQDFTRRFLGAISLEQTVETGRPDGMTLATAIELAAQGDEEAAALLDINVATAAAEALFKDGYISRIRKSIDADGNIRQFGVNLHQVHYNSYVLRPGRHDKLKQFTLAEALNGYREQAYLKAGLLDDYFLLVPSCVEESLPEELLDYRGEGWFTGSMSFALQATTKEGDEVVTDTVFRRGTAADADAPYLSRQARRFDLEAIGMVYESLGFDPPKTALEFLQRPLLLKKSEFPNGVLDVLRRCDIAADVLQDKIAERSQDEYANIRLESSLKDASLAAMKAAVKRDLMAAAGTFKAHEDANKLLWELVRKHAVRDAATNDLIDPVVFGPKAAPYIEEARQAYGSGDTQLGSQLLAQALATATIAGCGGGACGIKELTGAALGEAKSLLGAEPDEKVAADTERPCVKCGQKTVVYAWTESKVKKACTNPQCGAKEGASAAPSSPKPNPKLRRSLLALAA